MEGHKATTLELSYIFCFLLSIWIIFPGIYRNLPNVLIAFLFMGWLVTAHIGLNKIVLTRPIIAAMIYLLYILFYKSIGYSEVIINKYVQLIFFWVPIYFFTFYMKYGTHDKNKKLFYTLLISYNISFISNIVIMVKDPLATLMYNRIGGEHYLHTNIGETPYSFVGALLFVFSYYEIKKNKASHRWLFYSTMVTSVTMMVLMQRTITLILSAVAIVIYYYLKNTYNERLDRKLLWSLLLMGGIVLFCFEYM